MEQENKEIVKIEKVNPISEKVDNAVNAWFTQTFSNKELPTSLYNEFYLAKDKLKQQLKQLF